MWVKRGEALDAFTSVYRILQVCGHIFTSACSILNVQGACSEFAAKRRGVAGAGGVEGSRFTELPEGGPLQAGELHIHGLFQGG